MRYTFEGRQERPPQASQYGAPSFMVLPHSAHCFGIDGSIIVFLMGLLINVCTQETSRRMRFRISRAALSLHSSATVQYSLRAQQTKVM